MRSQYKGSASLLMALVAASLFTSCGESPSSGTSSHVLAANTQPSSSPTVTPPADITSSGPIVVENQLDVAAQRDGVVAQISADTGKSVRQGDVLAQLDDRQLTADRNAADAKLRAIGANIKNWQSEIKVLQTDLARSEKMWDAQIITREQLEHDRFKVEADQYELEREHENAINQQEVIRSLNLELEKTKILAPFDGVVARRYVRVGQRVATGDRLFWVTATAPLRVKFTLPERALGKVARGQVIGVSTPDIPDSQYQATVIQISPVVDPSSGTIEVLAEITNPHGSLRPGMTADVRIPQPR
jgi:membrane fusion protein, multidrug efflux system